MQGQSQAFIRAKNFTLSEKIEGGLSLDPKDRGNWTSGKVGEGTLLGSKYGISAAQYPTIDIPMLRFEDAVRIYHRDYWEPIKGDDLPPRLAVAVFDAAVNHGVMASAKLLQKVLGVKQDGQIGPVTLAAARQREQNDLIAEFVAARLLRYSELDTFRRFGKGWFTRCAYLLMEIAR